MKTNQTTPFSNNRKAETANTGSLSKFIRCEGKFAFIIVGAILNISLDYLPLSLHYITLLLCAEYAGYQTIPLSSLYYLPLPLHYITLMCRVHWVPDYTIVYDIAIYHTDHKCISVIVFI